MRKSILVLVLLLATLYSCGQEGQKVSDDQQSQERPTAEVTSDVSKRPLPPELQDQIHTQSRHELPDGGSLIIQNGYPKGGGSLDNGITRGYTDPLSGTTYSYGIFWTRMVNEGTTPVEINLRLPADLMTLDNSQGSHYKLIFPPDTMSLKKLSLYNYGVMGLIPFLNANFHQSTTLQRSLGPEESFMLNVALLLHAPGNGGIRTGFELKGTDFTYNVNLPPYGRDTISAGQILLEK